MPVRDNYDIIITGGGMMGASLALLLGQALPDKKILLLEARPFADPAGQPSQPSFDARSTALSPSSAELFHRLGLWQGLCDEASPINRIHVSDRGRPGRVCFGPEDNDGEPLGYVVPNVTLGLHLLARLESADAVEAVAPVDVVGLQPVRSGMRLQLRDEGRETEVEARLVILADGAGSPLAARLGIGTRTKSYGQCALIANVAYEKPHQGSAFERFTPEGPMALLPLRRQTESALVWTRPLNELDTLRHWSPAQLLENLQQAFGYRLGRFQRVSEPAFHPLSLQLAEEQVRSSLVLMGNAAHALHPVAGQGFNLALRDAARLTEVLVRGVASGHSPGDLSVLQIYERDQQRDQFTTVTLSDSFIRIFASEQLPVVAGRNLGLVSLELVPAWRDSFLMHMAGRAQPRARPITEG